MHAAAILARRFLAFLLALAVALPAFVMVPGSADAQSRKSRPNLLDVLRGKPKRTAPRRTKRRTTRRAQPRVTRRAKRTAPRRAKRTAPRRAKRTAKRTPKRAVRRTAKPKRPVVRRPAAPVAPEVEIVEKSEHALVVLVVGDFLAGGTADGLEAAFAESPGVVVVDASNGSSGLVREDYHDWQTLTPALIEEHDPAIVVVQLGANDGQVIRKDGQALSEGTDEWTAEYAARARRLAAAVEATDAELVWVGSPAFRSRSLSDDVLAFNAHYQAAAEAAGGAFVDVWEGFVDQNGTYVRSGPDVNGQTVRLRASDGINLTRAGKRKMAFFAEKEVRRLLGGADDLGFGSFDDIAFAPLGDDLLEAPLQPRMSTPMALGDPPVEEELEVGRSAIAPAAAAAPAINPGLAPPATEGVPADRADNFAWPQG